MRADAVSPRMAAKRGVARDEKRSEALARLLSLAEEHERRRIAIGLHDCVGQALALAKVKLSAMQASAVVAAEVAGLAEVREHLDQAIRATRSLSFELSSPILYEVGLAEALAERGERLAVASGARFELSVEEPCNPLTLQARIVLYRIAEELLVNVMKHASAKNVRLAISSRADEIRIVIEDDGVGINPAALANPPSPGGGLGLRAIRERLRDLGGRLEICPGPETGGSRFIVHAPLTMCA